MTGRVLVELVFTIADGRPKVQVVDSEGGDTFLDAVEVHVRSHARAVFAQREVPARLRFEYVFKPDDRQVHYAQPDMPNSVGEVGTSHPARRPFIEWLRTLQLGATDLMLNSIFVDTTTLAVPCLKIDL
ncbi:MAG: hypothetical protein H7Z19_23405 [Chitinophagaceae bacterium]|nr:hypothetical protein [Rubrivivax sp.]